jgi:hypothetical protein
MLAPDEVVPPPSCEFVLSRPSAAVLPPTIFYVIDISGSMCVTTPVTTAVRATIPSVSNRREDLAQFVERGAAQQLPSETAGTTYLSRLDCVKAAVRAHLSEYVRANPSHRAGLITFGTDVTIYHTDGRPPSVIAGEILGDSAKIAARATEVFANTSVPADGAPDVLGMLTGQLSTLEEGGATALGPALVACAGILPRYCGSGSRVVICTDGLANVGVGSLESSETGPDFYDAMASSFQASAASVDVISIKGEDCNLGSVSAIAAATRGSVDIVDPLDLAKRMSDLNRPVVATNVEVSLRASVPFDQEETRGENIGIATNDTFVSWPISFSPTTAATGEPICLQVSVTFRAPDGARLHRIFTKTVGQSQTREMTEQQADPSLLALSAIHHSAELAHRNDFDSARRHLISTMRMLQRCLTTASGGSDLGFENNPTDVYVRFIKEGERLDGFMRERQLQQGLLGTSEDSEDDVAARNIHQARFLSARAFETQCQ